MFFNSSFYIASHGAPLHFFFWTSFLFLQTFLLISSISLWFDSWIFCHLLANLFLSFWLFLALFWMLWMLITANKQCHVLHVSRITTRRTSFTKKRFGVSNEWARSWSHACQLTNLKTLPKNHLTVLPENWTRMKKLKRN